MREWTLMRKSSFGTFNGPLNNDGNDLLHWINEEINPHTTQIICLMKNFKYSSSEKWAQTIRLWLDNKIDVKLIIDHESVKNMSEKTYSLFRDLLSEEYHKSLIISISPKCFNLDMIFVESEDRKITFISNNFGSFQESENFAALKNPTVFEPSELNSSDNIPFSYVRPSPIFIPRMPLTISDTYEKDLKNSKIIEKIDLLPVVAQSQNGNVNLYRSIGRVNHSGQSYSKRPWYEIELNIGSGNFQNLPRDFIVHTDDGFILNLKRRSGGKAGYPETGMKDLTSSPRRDHFGIWLKSKFLKQGIIREGDLVTPEVLRIYGNSKLIFSKSLSGEFLLSF
jgi:hypothetical protein